MASAASEEDLADIRIFFANAIWRKFLPGIWNPNLKNSFHYNATPTPHITYKKLSPQSSNMMNLQENSTVVASNSPLSRVNLTTHWETVSEVWNWLRLYQWNYLFLRFNFKQSTVRGVTIHFQHCNSIYWPNFWNRSIFWREGLENICQRKALSSNSSR